MSINTCISCGADVPEGKQICWKCENTNVNKECWQCEYAQTNMIRNSVCSACQQKRLFNLRKDLQKQQNNNFTYHISWLDKAIRNFADSKEIHSIDGNMTLEEFILKWNNVEGLVRMND